MVFDDMVEKTNQLLERLRLLQIEQCCQHIDHQVGSWYKKHENNSIKQEDSHTVGCFLSNIKHLESFDSDATESTSSNDSYDELEGFNHQDIPPKKPFHRRLNLPGSFSGANISSTSTNVDAKKYPPDLEKRAIWKWAHERSRLASKWTWLQAQIADLEFKIRQQNDLNYQLRAHKTAPLAHRNVGASCSRTVPIHSHFQRRRLIKSNQILSNSTKRLVKYSVVPCICSSLPQTVSTCLSCNGRYNYLALSNNIGERLTFYERASSIDPCCHPTLSFPDDITLTSQLAALLTQETVSIKKNRPGRKKGSTNVQQNLNRNNNNSISNNTKDATKDAATRLGRKRLQQPSSLMLATQRLKRKYQKGNTGKNSWAHANRQRRISCSDANHFNINTNSNASAQSVTKRRRSEQSAYDIDNIVIPFSIAATTRVEILEYKEIVTPTWRVIENGSHQNDLENDESEDIEDISDEAYRVRHIKGETEEKKRFSLRPAHANSNNHSSSLHISSNN